MSDTRTYERIRYSYFRAEGNRRPWKFHGRRGKRHQSHGYGW